MTGRENSAWQGHVARLLGEGYGAEDIAIRLDCAADDVRPMTCGARWKF